MNLSVAEYARERGMSRQRVLSMIDAGQIEATRVGRAWVIDQRELGRRLAAGRPLGKRMTSIVIGAIEGRPLQELSPQDRFFAAGYLDRLESSTNPADLIYTWMRSRHIKVANLSAHQADLAEIARDRRIVPSGISDGRAGMSSARELEGYVSSDEVEKLTQDNLLVASASPNVRIHVVEELPERPIPLGFVLADLAEWNSPREDGRIAELLKGPPWRR